MLEPRGSTASAHAQFLMLTQLMRPAIGFNRPEDVLKDPALSAAEKREILAAWASDAFTPADHPSLRWLPGSDEPVPLLEIQDALRRVGDLPDGDALR